MLDLFFSLSLSLSIYPHTQICSSFLFTICLLYCFLHFFRTVFWSLPIQFIFFLSVSYWFLLARHKTALAVFHCIYGSSPLWWQQEYNSNNIWGLRNNFFLLYIFIYTLWTKLMAIMFWVCSFLQLPIYTYIYWRNLRKLIFFNSILLSDCYTFCLNAQTVRHKQIYNRNLLSFMNYVNLHTNTIIVVIVFIQWYIHT